jgi:PKD repeat protein
MKRILLLLILLNTLISVNSQGYIYITGMVTDSMTGNPVTGHAVTIMTDSTLGVFYYNTVYTDSSGYYWDDLPSMNDSTSIFYVSTVDCQGILHRAIITYNPVITQYTQDFVICNTNVLCDAYFTYEEQNGMNFQFANWSQGEMLSYLWEFGDGTTSAEINPLHGYTAPGTFDVCLTIRSYNCTDTYCETLVISDTVYTQIYGQVFAGNFPLSYGLVNIFSQNPDSSFSAMTEGCPVDSNGIFYFTLVPAGTYIIQAIPGDSSGYMPTYYNRVTDWQGATRIQLGNPENPYNINLVEHNVNTQYFGPGSLTGQIINLGMQRSRADKATVFLMNENAESIGFCKVNSAGEFVFNSLNYGVYNIKVELAGVSSDLMRFEISQEKPDLNVTLNYAGNSILGIEDQLDTKNSILVYPIPSSNKVWIDLNKIASQKVSVRIISISGSVVFENEMAARQDKVLEINVSDYPSGIYSLLINTGNGQLFARKIIISR